MIIFPKNFLWGAGTSAYQVEGNNVHSDWWEWEQRTQIPEPSGPACRHYELYEQDFDLAKSLNQNCHRLSIEWSRVEPEPGKFSDAEIRHYQDIILALRKRSMAPIVTLHHFTNPLWFAKIGGWENKDAEKLFERYVQKIVSALGGQVRFWVTINEPMVYAYHSCLIGLWPPQKKSILPALRVIGQLAQAHIKAYRLIHKIYDEQKWPAPQVSIAQHLRSFVPRDQSLRNRFAVYLKDQFFNQYFIKRALRAKSLDFLGVNYYTREVSDAKNWSPASLLFDIYQASPTEIKKSSMGWDVYPQGLRDQLLALKKYRLPVFILENGVSVSDDKERWDFIREHLKSVHEAMEQGASVMGYLYWSLVDNFEWHDGYAPRFGLVEVEYKDFRRTVRDSARKYAEVCRTGALS